MNWNEKYKEKCVSKEALFLLCQKLRKEGKTIATVNGSFDLLHAGHLHQLYAGSETADVFICLLNSDASIKQYKSEDRPIISLEHRKQMIAALSFVDYVSSFDETDPRTSLKLIQPDVHVNGAEYGEDCLEKEVVERFGGRIHIVPKIEGLSTTAIIQKIVQTCAV